MVQNDNRDCDGPQTFDVRPERNPVTPIGVQTADKGTKKGSRF